jgi:hypothetical protein
MTVKSLFHVAILGIVALSVSGCLGNKELVARWKKKCTDQGHVEGTAAFDKCWEDNRPRQVGGASGGGGGP